MESQNTKNTERGGVVWRDQGKIYRECRHEVNVKTLRTE
jgi:hypothetical protein